MSPAKTIGQETRRQNLRIMIVLPPLQTLQTFAPHLTVPSFRRARLDAADGLAR
jgi:hypothetical protein